MLNYEEMLFGVAPYVKDTMLFMKELDKDNPEKSLLRGRTGWIMRQIENPESIYEHCCKVGLASYYLFQTKHAVCKGVVHDFPENKRFDYIPGQIDKKEKIKLEFSGMLELKDSIPNGKYWNRVYSNFTKDKVLIELDKICPVIQAIDYSKIYKNHRLEEFYPHARRQLRTSELIELVDMIQNMKIPEGRSAYEYYFEGLKKIKL